MYELTENLSSMAEDFQFLGIVKKQLTENEDNTKNVSKETEKTKEVKQTALTEEAKTKIRSRLAESFKDSQKKKNSKRSGLTEEKRKEIRKRIEEQRKSLRNKRLNESRINRSVEKKGVKESLDNISRISNHLTSPKKMHEAIAKVKSIAEKAIGHLTKMESAEVTINTNDSTQNDVAGKKTPKEYDNLLKMNKAKEGNPENAKDDGIVGGKKMDTNIADTTGKQAGDMAYSKPSKEVNLMGESNEEDGLDELDKIEGSESETLKDEIDSTLAALLADNDEDNDSQDSVNNEQEKENKEKVNTESIKHIREQKQKFDRVVKESNDLLNSIKKFAISPQDAEKKLADIASYLGGAVKEMPVVKGEKTKEK